MDKGSTDWSNERGGGGEWGVGPAAALPGGSPDKVGSVSPRVSDPYSFDTDPDPAF